MTKMDIRWIQRSYDVTTVEEIKSTIIHSYFFEFEGLQARFEKIKKKGGTIMNFGLPETAIQKICY